MCIKITNTRRGGFTLVDVLISTALTSLLLLTLAGFSVYGSRVLGALGNYTQVESSSRMALDVLSQQIRQCRSVVTVSTNSVTVVDSDGANLQFSYDPTQQTLTRIKNGVTRVLLTNCQQLSFTSFQRTPISGSLSVYPAASTNTCKLIQVSWVCARNVLSVVNSDSVQSAKIVIRKNTNS